MPSGIEELSGYLGATLLFP